MNAEMWACFLKALPGLKNSNAQGPSSYRRADTCQDCGSSGLMLSGLPGSSLWGGQWRGERG